MDVCVAHLNEVVKARSKTLGGARTSLSHTEILARIAATCRGVCRHIAVVHLVNNDLRRLNLRCHILCPVLRVGVTHIHDSATVTIYIECAREDARSLTQSLALDGYLKGVVAALVVALHGGTP